MFCCNILRFICSIVTYERVFDRKKIKTDFFQSFSRKNFSSPFKRAVIRIPDPKEKKYYFDWAASEFKKTKTLDPEDSYVLNIRMAEAVQWAEQFEKIYKRTDEGYEKDRTDPRNMTPK